MSDGEWARPAQVFLVLACLAAIVVAAAAVPGLAGPTAGGGDGADDGGSGTVTTPGDDGDGSGGGGGVGIGDILRWLFGDGGGDRVPPEYDVRVDPEPVPGRTVTVTVRRRGMPVEGARVMFGEQPVGRTNASGQVRGEVPYGDSDLVVRVRPPARTTARTASALRGESAALGGSTLAPPAAVGGDMLVRQAEPTPSNVTERYDLPTTASVRVVGKANPGATVHIVAQVGGDPLPRATVRVNGDRAGRTDASGTHTIRVPDDGTRRLRLQVERGAVSGERTVPVRLLTLRIHPVDPLAIPGRPATVAARVGADPAANATVTVGGTRVGGTDAAGRARVTLPSDPTAQVVVSRGDRVTRRSFLTAYATTGVALGLPALALLAGLGALVRSRGRAARGVRRAGQEVARVAAWAARAVVQAGRWLKWIVLSLARTASRLASALARWARWIAGSPRRAVGWASPRVALALLLAGARWLLGLPGRAVGWIRKEQVDETTEGGEMTGVGEPVQSAADFEALWVAFARAVAPDGWRHRTPAEVGRAAVDRGLPAEPVERVTRAFRERAYARSELPPDEYERVVETLRALLSETEGEP